MEFRGELLLQLLVPIITFMFSEVGTAYNACSNRVKWIWRSVVVVLAVLFFIFGENISDFFSAFYDRDFLASPFFRIFRVIFFVAVGLLVIAFSCVEVARRVNKLKEEKAEAEEKRRQAEEERRRAEEEAAEKRRQEENKKWNRAHWFAPWLWKQV